MKDQKSTLPNSFYNNLDQEHYLPVFKRFPIAICCGSGSRVRDADGKEYIDALAGIAVNNVGHCHPKVVAAIREQAGKLMHISNFFVSEPQVKLSKRLTALADMSRVFFTNSGAESVEGAIKLARKYAHSKGRGGTIISFHGSFHGRTMATIATGKRKMQEGFDPIPHGFKQVPFNDFEAVKNAVDNDTAAILIEPIQGEGGINPADLSFLKDLRKLCDEENIALIFDEIQCGMGRTGHFFAKDLYGVQPDIMTLAKGLGAGVPIGAILSNEMISAAIDFGDHGTTFGGNPLVCAAALACLDVIEDENLLEAASEKGEWFKREVLNLNDPHIREIRGEGLMLGIDFNFEAKPIVLDMLENGVIANATAGSVVRIVPPLNITYEDLEHILKTLKNSILKVKAHAEA
ncbi:MAG: aspartate aminotransferase family protein [Cryomorphaceae bacterium]|nr:aspartate aminotransferase family protein [Flavobacteriales bacterium]